jgi:hypothetical protein
MRWDFEEPFQPQDLRGTLESLGAEVSDGFDYRFTPSPISGVEVQSLQEAVRLGGPDFLTQVIAECVRLLAPDSAAQQLPDAIDPNSFS